MAIEMMEEIMKEMEKGEMVYAPINQDIQTGDYRPKQRI